MSERSGFFNSQETSAGVYDRKYNEEDFSNIFKQFFGNGIMVSEDEINSNSIYDKTTCNGLKPIKAGNNIQINIGYAFINGYWYYNDEILTMPINSEGTLVLEYSSSERKISLKIITGNLQQNDDIYDISIALIQLSGTSYTVTDSRTQFITTSLKAVQNIADNVEGSFIDSFKDRFYVFETSSSVSVQGEGIGVQSIVDSVNLPVGFGNNDVSKVCVIFAGVEKQLTVDGENKYTLRKAYNQEILSYNAYGVDKIENYVSPSVSGVESVGNRIVVPMRVYYNRDDYMKGQNTSVLTIYRRYVFLDLS